tara:strand:- start:72 stop:416 length:345 start_codon:yes stop_codon:yes gene_type:complete
MGAVHVQLGRPLYVRKLVLQTAIEAAQVLKDYDSFKQVHAMKKGKFSRLSTLMKNIKTKSKALEKSNFPALPREQKVRKVVTKVKETLEVKKDGSEIDKLKAELGEIEARLKEL